MRHKLVQTAVGRLHVAANMAGAESPLANQRPASVQPGSLLTSLRGAGLTGVRPQAVFSVGVLLQLNISTRLSVGPSRSVIYTILLMVDCG